MSVTVVSYGGGTNSCAMLVGLHERGERPDYILFADTGGEKPHTYAHIAEVAAWCGAVGFPLIHCVREELAGPLEADCLRRNTLPSIAFGYKTCSQRWKARPQERFMSELGIVEYTKLIGFDAGEPHRAREILGNRYPLIEWNWGRDECKAAIQRGGLSQPGKSSCFFCPSSTKKDVMELRLLYPDLAARAVAMENNATEATTAQGLGRHWAWRDLYAADDGQAKLFAEPTTEIACECYDEAAP